MGIQKAYDLIEHMVLQEKRTLDKRRAQCIALDKIKQNCNEFDDINVYVDGNLFLFSGNIDRNDANEEAIGDDACKYLIHLLYRISTIVNINRILIYFDGERPNIKSTVSKIRKTFVKFNINDALNHFIINIINSKENVEIINLHFGESEHEMFVRRDVSRPSLLLSDDSDLFHITFGYEKISTQDIVMIAGRKLERFYRMDSDFLRFSDMPRLVFATLMFLKGSDFTSNTITSTMSVTFIKQWLKPSNEECRLVKLALIKYCEQFINVENKIRSRINEDFNLTMNDIIEMDDEDSSDSNYYKLIQQSRKSYGMVYNFIDVTFVMRLILKIIVYSTSCYKFSWNNSSKEQSNSNEMINYIKTVMWSVNYSLIGCNMRRYNQTHYVRKNISPLPFYAYLLLQHELETLPILTPGIFKSLIQFIPIPLEMSDIGKCDFVTYHCTCVKSDDDNRKIMKSYSNILQSKHNNNVRLSYESFSCLLTAYMKYAKSRRFELTYAQYDILENIKNHKYSEYYDLKWCLYPNDANINDYCTSTNIILPILLKRKRSKSWDAGSFSNYLLMLDIRCANEYLNFVDSHLGVAIFSKEREESMRFFKKISTYKYS